MKSKAYQKCSYVHSIVFHLSKLLRLSDGFKYFLSIFDMFSKILNPGIKNMTQRMLP